MILIPIRGKSLKHKSDINDIIIFVIFLKNTATSPFMSDFLSRFPWIHQVKTLPNQKEIHMRKPGGWLYQMF